MNFRIYFVFLAYLTTSCTVTTTYNSIIISSNIEYKTEHEKFAYQRIFELLKLNNEISENKLYVVNKINTIEYYKNIIDDRLISYWEHHYIKNFDYRCIGYVAIVSNGESFGAFVDFYHRAGEGYYRCPGLVYTFLEGGEVTKVIVSGTEY